MRPVNKDEYWKERLEATDADILHKAVLEYRLEEFQELESIHAKILEPYFNIKVLDAGCGYGRMSKYFTNYTGVDISKTLIKKAKDLYPNKKFIVGDLQKLNFKDKEFDLAFCCVVKNMIIKDLGIEYWEVVESELNRVAKELIILETL